MQSIPYLPLTELTVSFATQVTSRELSWESSLAKIYCVVLPLFALIEVLIKLLCNGGIGIANGILYLKSKLSKPAAVSSAAPVPISTQTPTPPNVVPASTAPLAVAPPPPMPAKPPARALEVPLHPRPETASVTNAPPTPAGRLRLEARRPSMPVISGRGAFGTNPTTPTDPSKRQKKGTQRGRSAPNSPKGFTSTPRSDSRGGTSRIGRSMQGWQSLFG
jgi:hypothetical protein